MVRKTLPFAGGFADPNIVGIDYSIPINFKYDNYMGFADNFTAMVPTPGIARFTEITIGAGTVVRGMFVMDGKIFAVFGDRLVELLPTIVSNELTGFSESDKGTLLTTTGNVEFAASNNNELAICDGEFLYSYIEAATDPFVNVTSTNFTDANHGTGNGFADINDIDFINNRFIFTRKDTSIFYVSIDVPFDQTTAGAATGAALTRLREGLAGANAKYRQAQLTARADTLKGIIVNNLNFYLFGTRVVETWSPAGVAGIPFRRQNGQVYDVGAASTDSIAQATGPTGYDITVFLATDIRGALDVKVLGLQGAQSITNAAIQGLLANNVREPQNAIGFLFREDNDLYYQLTFPGDDNLTIVYDFERQMWHRLTDQAGNRHRANCFVHFNLDSFKGGYNFIGDHESGFIYRYSADILTEADSDSTTYLAGTVLNGVVLVGPEEDRTFPNEAIATPRTYFTPYLQSPDEKRVRVNRVELNCVQGLGNTDNNVGDNTAPLPSYAADRDPQIFLSASRDKGRTFEDAHADGIGKVGFYKTRTRYHRFGHSHDGWVFKVQTFTKQPIIIISMVADLEVGNE